MNLGPRRSPVDHRGNLFASKESGVGIVDSCDPSWVARRPRRCRFRRVSLKKPWCKSRGSRWWSPLSSSFRHGLDKWSNMSRSRIRERWRSNRSRERTASRWGQTARSSAPTRVAAAERTRESGGGGSPGKFGGERPKFGQKRNVRTGVNFGGERASKYVRTAANLFPRFRGSSAESR